jgi:hypothetical protein
MLAGRVRILPQRGTLLVSGDLHGHLGDFATLRGVFEDLRTRFVEAHWVLLGDLVHGPSDEARARQPELYDAPDESWAVIAAVRELVARHPGRVHVVLGNHDYGHVGGPHTAKFHADEVAQLEASLSPAQLEQLRALYASALLAVVAPCGALLCHGSPNLSLLALADLDRVCLPPQTDRERALIAAVVQGYGQPGPVATEVLACASRDAGHRLTMILHGHDRDEVGWFTEGGNQLCPVIFGAPRAQRRYLRLDLGVQYRSLADLREDEEILRLYP